MHGVGSQEARMAEKAGILAAAKKDGLTGEQFAKRFGVATLTFYRWQGPVRKRKKGEGRGRWRFLER
jgi:transposase